LQYKIREAQEQKIPYMIIVGDQEELNQTLSIRKLDGTKQNDVPLKEFIKRLKEEAKVPSPKLSKTYRR
jgi:threonyl-tRNA synthetase